MIALNLIVFSVLLTNCVIGKNTGRGNVRHRLADEYKSTVNHPPAPESYESIPVAVVYEDEIKREDKSFKTVAAKTNVEQVSNTEPPKNEASTTTQSSHTNISDIGKINPNPKKEETIVSNPDSSEPIEKEPITNSVQLQLHIPVKIVYDTESSYYERTRPTSNRIATKRRKVQRPLAKEKEVTVTEALDTNVAENVFKHPIPVANQEDLRVKRRKVQRPSAEGIEVDVIPKQEEFSTERQKVPRPSVGESKVAVAEDLDTSVTENRHTHPIPVANQEDLRAKRRKVQRPSAEGIEVAVTETFDTRVTEKEYQQPIPMAKQEQMTVESNPRFSKRNNSTRQREVIPIIQSENLVFSHSGNFQYSYEGGDGSKAFEKGQLKTYDDDSAGEAVSGGFSYTAKDGKEYSLSYTADENGYRPVGAHLPTPPPIPPAIARALAYLATKSTPEPVSESINEPDYK